MERLKGNTTKARMWALTIYNLIALIVSIAMVAVIPVNTPEIKGLIFCFSYLAYFFVPEALFARTFGKKIHKLIICDLNGKKPGVYAAFIRTLLRIIEVNPLLFGGLPAGLVLISSDRKQRVGDMLARTVVVDEKELDAYVAEQVVAADASSGPR